MGRQKIHPDDATKQREYRRRKKEAEGRMQMQQAAAWDSRPATLGWSPPNLAALEAAVTIPDPSTLPHFHVTAPVRRAVEAAVALSAYQRMVVVQLTGDPGIGKSSLARWTAATFQRRFLSVNCPLIKYRNDWFFTRELLEKRTITVPTAFAYALQLGGAIILLDEANRIEPHLLGVLNPFLDDQGGAYIQEFGRRLEVGWGTLLFVTANENAGGRREFSGTFPMDWAFKDRCDLKIELTAPDPRTLSGVLVARCHCTPEQARQIVEVREVINRQAQGDPSGAGFRKVGTRQVLRVASLVARTRLTLEEAFDVAVLNDYSAEGGTASVRYRIAEIIKGKLREVR